MKHDEYSFSRSHLHFYLLMLVTNSLIHSTREELVLLFVHWWRWGREVIHACALSWGPWKPCRFGSSPNLGETNRKNKSGKKSRGCLGLLDRISRGQEQLKNYKHFSSKVFFTSNFTNKNPFSIMEPKGWSWLIGTTETSLLSQLSWLLHLKSHPPLKVHKIFLSRIFRCWTWADLELLTL